MVASAGHLETPCGIAHVLLTRNKELIPKEGLQRIEIEACLSQKVYIIVLRLDISAIVTVDDEHVVGRKFSAGHFEPQQG